MPESILLFGEFGSGKSYALLTTAQHFPNSKFWMLDMEGSLRTQMEMLFGNLPNVTIFPCNSWTDVEKAMGIVQDRVTLEDWICVDGLNRWWEEAQKYYIEQIFGTSRADYFMMKRREAEEAQKTSVTMLEGWKDWSIIKKIHNDPLEDLAHRRICNVMMATRARSLEQTDGLEVRTHYQHVGFRPEGEKGNPYRFDTFILLEALKKGQGNDESIVFALTTLRDRWSAGSARRYQIKVDFWTAYQELRKAQLKPPGLK